MTASSKLPRAFDLRPWAYFLDFVVMPPIVIACVAWSSLNISAALWFVVGVVAWTIAEYGIHRILFHHVASFRLMHDMHHRNPKGFVGVATWGSAAAFAVAFAAVAVAAGSAIAAAFTAGLISAYLFYCAIHVRFHHGDPARFGRYVTFMAAHHDSHHRGGSGNFGVSSPLWDMMFRTYRKARR